MKAFKGNDCGAPRTPDTRFRAKGLGCRVWELGFRVSGLGFRI